jgi:hypothetical protein
MHFARDNNVMCSAQSAHLYFPNIKSGLFFIRSSLYFLSDVELEADEARIRIKSPQGLSNKEREKGTDIDRHGLVLP